MNVLPDRPGGEASPPRRLNAEQMELVIRRAVELQAGASDASAEEGISEAELIRIGREIGVAPQYMRRALAEAATPPAAPPALGERVFGPAAARAERVVPGTPEQVAAHLDLYLTQRERLAPVRRFPERTLYAKAPGSGLAGVVEMIDLDELMRGERQPRVGAGYKLKDARQLEVVVRPLEDGFSHVALAADLSSARTGWAAAGLTLGGGGALTVAAALGIAVDPLAALLGLPVLGGGLLGARAAQSSNASRARTHLESLLDCLERGEPLVRPRARRG